MTILEEMALRVEIYSIDEAFPRRASASVCLWRRSVRLSASACTKRPACWSGSVSRPQNLSQLANHAAKLGRKPTVWWIYRISIVSVNCCHWYRSAKCGASGADQQKLNLMGD